MNQPRWYPSLTELADGRYVVISGNTTDATHWADTPEVYDPATNTWTLLTGVSTSQVHEEEYPFSYLPPNGKVFTIGPVEDVSFFLDVNNKTWTPVGGPAAWSTARRSCTGPARSSTPAARRTSTRRRRRRRPRP